MIPITFEEAIGYFGVYVFLMAVAGGLIVGLYYLADIVEANLKTTKKVIVYTAQGLLAVLALLWVLEGVDVWTMVPTIAAPLGYWHVVHRTFPFISPSNPVLLLSAGMTLWAHGMWMKYHMSTFHHISVVLGFFLVVVWVVPFMILISLAANDNVLPGVASGMPAGFYRSGGGNGGGAGAEAGTGRGAGGRGGRGTRTLLASLFDGLRGQGHGGSGRQKERSY
ncbi:hypothetical protein HYH02_009948 [Chlamydomonas schloesseri]|uniref:Uncharacterized protein n=1 Tax=Chlamydomonas schloesseri TaxID=2026947 RepID=A0A835W9F6_9CHLO|nr:hypothetical protein HYH02_009948 [Chlamydomonas schloesseri]|eukprot:KAG2441356.1 hypothetical protein HYH02_009948 [Chlamydomonas schloesseri]